MSKIFVGSDSRSLAVEWFAKYTKAVDNDHVVIVQASPDDQEILNIPILPCLLVKEGDRVVKNTSPYSIMRFIANAMKFEPIFFGKTESEELQILSSIEVAERSTVEELAAYFNKELTLKMFLVTFHITAADFIAFSKVVAHVQGLQDHEKVANANLFRWCDHLQHLPYLQNLVAAKELTITFPDENAKPLSKAQLKKLQKEQWKKEQKANGGKGGDKQGKKEGQKPAQKEEKKEETKDQKNQDENKKQKKQKQKQNKKPAAQDDVHPMSVVDIRVGKITKVWEMPDKDKMYAEEIDMGNGETRTIASGLKHHVPIEKMQDAMVLVVYNLLPRKMGDFTSNGMVLAAETPDKETIELLPAPEGSQPGDVVTIEGYERKPIEKLHKSSKKNQFFLVSPEFKIDENGVAKYQDAAWSTPSGPVVATNIKNGIIG